MSNLGIILPRPDSVGILLAAFPEFRERLDPEDLRLPHFVYGQFMYYLKEFPSDTAVWQRAWVFFNGLAQRKDPHPELEEILQVCVLEALASHKVNLEAARRMLKGRAFELLSIVETYVEAE